MLYGETYSNFYLQSKKILFNRLQDELLTIIFYVKELGETGKLRQDVGTVK